VSIVPFYWMFISSLKTPPEIMSRNIQWFPPNPQWENFVKAFSFMHPSLARALLNSTIVTVSSVGLMLLASSLTGFALAKYKFRGSRLVFLYIISTMMIPSFVTLIPFYLIVNWLGWIDTYWPLIIPGVVSAYSVFLFRQYIITIPDQILDAARLCGCSEFGLYWRMILPLSKPVLAALGLVNAVWVWNDLLVPMIMIHNRDLYTVQLALAGLWDIHGQLSALNLVMACTTLATLPLIVVTIIVSKHLIKGWTGLSYAKR